MVLESQYITRHQFAVGVACVYTLAVDGEDVALPDTRRHDGDVRHRRHAGLRRENDGKSDKMMGKVMGKVTKMIEEVSK